MKTTTGKSAIGKSVIRALLAFMTIVDYHVTMSRVRVAELKSRLSEHLRKARAGRPVTVLDRNTPIARIVPYEKDGASLTVRLPLPGSPRIKQIPMPPPLRLRRDIVALLLEERQGER
jgi:prevent-host-death family protein